MNEVASRAQLKAVLLPTFDIQPGMSAEGDPKLIRILFTALIDNAIKFGPKDRPAEIKISESEGQFVVSDNGIGFEADQSERVFRPLERLLGDEYPGVGMGLATARVAVHKHGGHISAAGVPGEGATFRFTLGD